MKLLEKIALGGKALKNRMAMAPMTRSRAGKLGIPNELTALYYQQRTSAGLIISEGINISRDALGSPDTPGLFNAEQIKAWKIVTNSVHKSDGVIYAQLWHTGRIGHSVDRDGRLPVAPSAIGIDGQHFTSQGLKDFQVPRQLETEEVKQIIEDYRLAAINAIEAGFDGVELHAAFGYLPNQFLAESANHRTDEYGGNIVNRNRFVLETIKALVDAVGGHRVGIKLSPTITYNGIMHLDPVAQFTPLLAELENFPLSYIHLMNGGATDFPNYPENVINTFGKLTNHFIIANCGYDQGTAEAELSNGRVGMISFGSLFLANPDLPKRFQLGANLNVADAETMYGGNERGYTDYPFLKT